MDGVQGRAERKVDLLVVGGGVNGCGIARDAAGRGLSVLLCEQGDLAGATSSASSKLVHGGLRYLEHYEFRLVRESLAEREVLLACAPHIIRPLRFVLPHHPGLRPAWMLRLGLLFYDHLGPRKRLAPTRGVALRRDPVGRPLRPRYVRGFEYSDCWVDDARLTALLAVDAAERGAVVLTRTRLERAVREAGGWRATLMAGEGGGGRTTTVRAKAVVNAAGPWVADALQRCFRRAPLLAWDAARAAPACGWSRAAMWSSPASTRGRRPIRCRARTGGWCSPSPMRADSP